MGFMSMLWGGDTDSAQFVLIALATFAVAWLGGWILQNQLHQRMHSSTRSMSPKRPDETERALRNRYLHGDLGIDEYLDHRLRHRWSRR